jgi:hypothetical protein
VTAEAASIGDIRIKGPHGHLVLGRTEGDAVQLRLKLNSRELQLNRSLAVADWRLLSWRLAMTRIAHCGCGSLRAEATDEPALLGVCHLPTPYWLGLWRRHLFATRRSRAAFHLEPDPQ